MSLQRQPDPRLLRDMDTPTLDGDPNPRCPHGCRPRSPMPWVDDQWRCPKCGEEHAPDLPVDVIDWRALFIKYRRHVGECEGVDFLEHLSHDYPRGFTPDEVAAILLTEEETWPTTTGRSAAGA